MLGLVAGEVCIILCCTWSRIRRRFVRSCFARSERYTFNKDCKVSTSCRFRLKSCLFPLMMTAPA